MCYKFWKIPADNFQGGIAMVNLQELIYR